MFRLILNTVAWLILLTASYISVHMVAIFLEQCRGARPLVVIMPGDKIPDPRDDADAPDVWVPPADVHPTSLAAFEDWCFQTRAHGTLQLIKQYRRDLETERARQAHDRKTFQPGTPQPDRDPHPRQAD